MPRQDAAVAARKEGGVGAVVAAMGRHPADAAVQVTLLQISMCVWGGGGGEIRGDGLEGGMVDASDFAECCPLGYPFLCPVRAPRV